MTDTLTAEQRSERMARIRGKDTAPELRLRRLVHGMGFRYRLHGASLPGKPDLVFRRRGCVIFMHGCFWHRHPGCKLARIPKSRVSFWKSKLDANRARDIANKEQLVSEGWRVLVVWECQVRETDKVRRIVHDFLKNKLERECYEIN